MEAKGFLEVIEQQTGGGPLASKPDLLEGLENYYEAFIRLSFARTKGPNAPNPIQITEMIAFADCFGFNDREFFLRIVQAADFQFLRSLLQKSEG